MAQLWTSLGKKHRRQLAVYNENRDLLAEMSRHRGKAREQVSLTIRQLTKLSDDLEDLRKRVRKPVATGADTVLPLEAHLESVRRGVERLGTAKENRMIECAYLFRQRNGHLELICTYREKKQMRNLLKKQGNHERRISS